jgi:hypothetical protein
MLQKIKTLIFSLSLLIIPVIPLAAPVGVLAQDDPIQGGLCHGAQDLEVTLGTTTCTQQAQNGIEDLVKKVVNILSVVVGVVAVIMIIVGGFRYITSGGSTERVTAAKNTILYALVGLVIVALAQVIVRFVLTKATTAS